MARQTPCLSSGISWTQIIAAVATSLANMLLPGGMLTDVCLEDERWGVVCSNTHVSPLNTLITLNVFFSQRSHQRTYLVPGLPHSTATY